MDLTTSMKREIDDFPDLVGAFITSPSHPPSTSTFTPTRVAGDSFAVSPSLLEPAFPGLPSREEYACAACGYEIRERYLLRVMDDFWHEMCLRCFSCDRALSEKDTCFVKDGRVYCKEDHSQ
uniref:LIM zinc-binding domain-containing protein n=1 Tax=Steinernema glaseri TaxID=37863 RepID=A0A1I8A4E1_9BILA